MSSLDKEMNECSWGSRRAYMGALLTQVIGIGTYISIPHRAVTNGAVGHILSYMLIYIAIGIPLFYMELIVGQFTGRDCLGVWQVRSFLSHLGYVYILWQLVFVTYCQVVNSAVLHYFLISFEDPIPYYVCGSWSNRMCNILKTNYTVNQDCIRSRASHRYCDKLFTTYPEYQYWRFNILGLNKTRFHVPWQVGLASILLCIAVYLSCFKRIKSVRWVLCSLTLYHTLGHILLMIGSMVQKGIVLKFEEALDTDFSIFVEYFDFTGMVTEIILSLNIGTGISFNLASSTTFRSPCYSNSVVCVVLSFASAVLGICNMAMMSCPYAYEFNIKPGSVLLKKITYTFEKMPRLLHEYQSTGFWLVIMFSNTIASALSFNILIISCLLETFARRKLLVAKYPGFVMFAIVIILYATTLPLLSNFAFNFMMGFKRVFSLITIVMVVMENLVFVLWYGLDRFAEDVHFMQGTQPRVWVKVGWVFSSVILSYVFFKEVHKIYYLSVDNLGMKAGCWCLVAAIAWILIVPLIRLGITLCQRKFTEMTRLDPSWGPKSEILQRSRAMFTAQAMTKEYMYRQYHLQAGIINRQLKSNVRNPDFGRNTQNT